MDVRAHTPLALAGKQVLVVGLGLSGVAVARFLSAATARVTVNDIRAADELGAILEQLPEGVRTHLGGHPDASGFSIANGTDGCGRADMGDMHRSAGQLAERNVAQHHNTLADAGDATNSQFF